LANIELITVLKEVVSIKGFSHCIPNYQPPIAPGSFGTLRGFSISKLSPKAHPVGVKILSISADIYI
jgi:hypothetical protein